MENIIIFSGPLGQARFEALKLSLNTCEKTSRGDILIDS